MERLRNYYRLKKTEETWQLNTICESELSPFIRKDIIRDNERTLDKVSHNRLVLLSGFAGCILSYKGEYPCL